MGIQDILDKIAEEGISLWDVKGYTFTILDSNGKQLIIKSFKLDSADKKIRVKLG